MKVGHVFTASIAVKSGHVQDDPRPLTSSMKSFTQFGIGRVVDDGVITYLGSGHYLVCMTGVDWGWRGRYLDGG